MLNYFKSYLVFLFWVCFTLTSHYFIVTYYFNEKVAIPTKITKNIELLTAQEIKTYFQNNDIKNYQLKILNKVNYGLLKKVEIHQK